MRGKVYLCIYSLAMASKSLLANSPLKNNTDYSRTSEKCLKKDGREWGFSAFAQCCCVADCSQHLWTNLKQLWCPLVLATATFGCCSSANRGSYKEDPMLQQGSDAHFITPPQQSWPPAPQSAIRALLLDTVSVFALCNNSMLSF